MLLVKEEKDEVGDRHKNQFWRILKILMMTTTIHTPQLWDLIVRNACLSNLIYTFAYCTRSNSWLLAPQPNLQRDTYPIFKQTQAQKDRVQIATIHIFYIMVRKAPVINSTWWKLFFCKLFVFCWMKIGFVSLLDFREIKKEEIFSSEPSPADFWQTFWNSESSKNGTCKILIKIRRPLFNTNTPGICIEKWY